MKRIAYNLLAFGFAMALTTLVKAQTWTDIGAPGFTTNSYSTTPGANNVDYAPSMAAYGGVPYVVFSDAACYKTSQEQPLLI